MSRTLPVIIGHLGPLIDDAAIAAAGVRLDAPLELENQQHRRDRIARQCPCARREHRCLRVQSRAHLTAFRIPCPTRHGRSPSCPPRRQVAQVTAAEGNSAVPTARPSALSTSLAPIADQLMTAARRADCGSSPGTANTSRPCSSACCAVISEPLLLRGLDDERAERKPADDAIPLREVNAHAARCAAEIRRRARRARGYVLRAQCSCRGYTMSRPVPQTAIVRPSASARLRDSRQSMPSASPLVMVSPLARRTPRSCARCRARSTVGLARADNGELRRMKGARRRPAHRAPAGARVVCASNLG